MKENNVKKIVFSSSATVYGIPQQLPITEDHPTGQGCTNPYGKSKYFVEEILKDVCTSDPVRKLNSFTNSLAYLAKEFQEWRVILLRYFNPVGAHESGLIGEDPAGIPNNLMPYISQVYVKFNESSYLCNNSIFQVAVGLRGELKVFGSDYDTKDGTGVRDYIHITDLSIGHVYALKKIMNSEMTGWKAYNLGTGRGYSVLEMINAFKKASGQTIKYDIVDRREGDVAASYADPMLARKELGWIATKDIDDMCKDAWNWQNKNPKGFQNS